MSVSLFRICIECDLAVDLSCVKYTYGLLLYLMFIKSIQCYGYLYFQLARHSTNRQESLTTSYNEICNATNSRFSFLKLETRF